MEQCPLAQLSYTCDLISHTLTHTERDSVRHSLIAPQLRREIATYQSVNHRGAAAQWTSPDECTPERRVCLNRFLFSCACNLRGVDTQRLHHPAEVKLRKASQYPARWRQLIPSLRITVKAETALHREVPLLPLASSLQMPSASNGTTKAHAVNSLPTPKAR